MPDPKNPAAVEANIDKMLGIAHRIAVKGTPLEAYAWEKLTPAEKEVYRLIFTFGAVAASPEMRHELEDAVSKMEQARKEDA